MLQLFTENFVVRAFSEEYFPAAVFPSWQAWPAGYWRGCSSLQGSVLPERLPFKYSLFVQHTERSLQLFTTYVLNFQWLCAALRPLVLMKAGTVTRASSQFSIEAFKFCKEIWSLIWPFPYNIGASVPGSSTFLQSSKITCCFWSYSVLRRKGVGTAIAEHYSALVGPCSCSGSGVWAQLRDVNSYNWPKLFQR